MSDAELRKQSRYTWWLVAFSSVVIWFLAQQTRATAKQEISEPAVTHTAGLMIETGSHLR